MQRKALLSIKTLALYHPPKHSTPEAYSPTFFPARANFPRRIIFVISSCRTSFFSNFSSPSLAFAHPSLCLRSKSVSGPL